MALMFHGNNAQDEVSHSHGLPSPGHNPLAEIDVCRRGLTKPLLDYYSSFTTSTSSSSPALGMKFYAVKKGFVPGIYLTWEACKEHVHCFKRSEFKSFKSLAKAHKYMVG